MNTKLNNWFITPDYKDEDGIYCEFINYYSYMSLLNDFDNNDVHNTQENDDRKIFLGYYNDDTNYFLNHTGFRSGNINGSFTKDSEYIVFSKYPFPCSETSNGNFLDLDDLLDYDDTYGNYYYYDGSGVASDFGFIDGSSN